MSTKTDRLEEIEQWAYSYGGPSEQVEWLIAEVKRLRSCVGQAFDAMDHRGNYSAKHFTKYPCECGAMISNSGFAARSHLRGTVHRENMERKALGLDPV